MLLKRRSRTRNQRRASSSSWWRLYAGLVTPLGMAGAGPGTRLEIGEAGSGERAGCGDASGPRLPEKRPDSGPVSLSWRTRGSRPRRRRQAGGEAPHLKSSYCRSLIAGKRCHGENVRCGPTKCANPSHTADRRYPRSTHSDPGAFFDSAQPLLRATSTIWSGKAEDPGQDPGPDRSRHAGRSA